MTVEFISDCALRLTKDLTIRVCAKTGAIATRQETNVMINFFMMELLFSHLVMSETSKR